MPSVERMDRTSLPRCDTMKLESCNQNSQPDTDLPASKKEYQNWHKIETCACLNVADEYTSLSSASTSQLANLCIHELRSRVRSRMSSRPTWKKMADTFSTTPAVLLDLCLQPDLKVEVTARTICSNHIPIPLVTIKYQLALEGLDSSITRDPFGTLANSQGLFM
uniref:Uncharacterized protein n=1 Tax=Physcomitrium patens TaxID=3218 RepID=A0A2K1JI62_PHYPA|nr:hypothetical protein PHYPA_018646 [Physcomitrium patens]